MKSVGMRTSNATPIQKSEKSSARVRESRRVPRVKERKRASGVKVRTSWRARNDCEAC